jgi:hypothetical protein
MQLIRTCTAVIVGTILVAGPAVAGQRGHRPAPPPAATHAAPPSHPAGSPKVTPPGHATVVPQQITANPALVTRLTPLLPAGMTLASAAEGFKNQGQFIAALHVSRNLNIPFTQLKADMTGTKHLSLGQAIQDLRPTTDVHSAVRTAETASRADLKAAKRPKTHADERR